MAPFLGIGVACSKYSPFNNRGKECQARQGVFDIHKALPASDQNFAVKIFGVGSHNRGGPAISLSIAFENFVRGDLFKARGGRSPVPGFRSQAGKFCGSPERARSYPAANPIRSMSDGELTGLFFCVRAPP
jgi:hypothetical protein